jgi:hypothetical protein
LIFVITLIIIIDGLMPRFPRFLWLFKYFKLRKDLTYLSELSEQNILGSESSANQSMLISGSSIISENILEEVKESEVNTEYPNLVYAEFMTLITKHKINNTAGK